MLIPAGHSRIACLQTEDVEAIELLPLLLLHERRLITCFYGKGLVLPSQSNCFLDFAVFEAGGTVELELVSNSEGITCGEDGLPPSVSTGGFD